MMLLTTTLAICMSIGIPADQADAQAHLTAAVTALNPPQPNDPAWQQAAMQVRADAAEYAQRWPDDPRGLETVGALSVSLNDHEGVDAAFSALLDTWPENASAGIAWVNYWQTHDMARAISLLENLLTKQPNRLLYINRLHTLFFQVDPERLRARFLAMQQEGDDDRAAMELDITARIAPSFAADIGSHLRITAPNHLPLAVATARGWRNHNRFDQARRILSEFDERSFTDPTHAYLWSDVLYADHDFAKAHEIMSGIDMDAIAEDGKVGLHRRLRFMKPLREEMAQLWPAEAALRHQQAQEANNPIALIIIDGREVIVELFEDDAPNTVANFIAAADLGIYDGWEAGQVHTGFRTIMGDRHEEDGWPAWNIPDEHQDASPRPIGSGSLVAYKTSRHHSTETTFYVLHFPAPHLNGQRVNFGRVISGLDVIRDMSQGDVVDSITILRRRDHEYDPTIIDSDGTWQPLSELIESHHTP